MLVYSSQIRWLSWPVHVTSWRHGILVVSHILLYTVWQERIRIVIIPMLLLSLRHFILRYLRLSFLTHASIIATIGIVRNGVHRAGMSHIRILRNSG